MAQRVPESTCPPGVIGSMCRHDPRRGSADCRCGSRGAETVYVGLGGSATVDGGVGMLQALGARVLDASGGQVVHGLYGVRDIDAIDLAPARAALAGVRLVALSDVKSPLVGPRGAVRMFGPQKGLGAGLSEAERDEVLAACDGWMAAYGARLTAARDALDGSAEQVGAPRRSAQVPTRRPRFRRCGRLGGRAARAWCRKLVPGIEAVLGMAGFDDAVRAADLVVTGEGAVDAQTAQGKVPVGVARRAKRLRPDVPVIAYAALAKMSSRQCMPRVSMRCFPWGRPRRHSMRPWIPIVLAGTFGWRVRPSTDLRPWRKVSALGVWARRVGARRVAPERLL